MKQTAKLLTIMAELCTALAAEEVSNDDRHVELANEVRELGHGQSRLFLDNQTMRADIGKLAAHMTGIPSVTVQALARTLVPQKDRRGGDREPITETDTLPLECASCGFKQEIPCRFSTHFYSERAEVASNAGWGVTVIPGKAILYFCQADSHPAAMAASIEKRAART